MLTFFSRNKYSHTIIIVPGIITVAIIIAIILVHLRRDYIFRMVPRICLVERIYVNRFLFPLLFISRREITIHPIVLALCPRDIRRFDHVHFLQRFLRSPIPADPQLFLRQFTTVLHNHRFLLLVVVVVVVYHRGLVLAVGNHCRRTPIGFIQRGTWRYVGALTLAKTFGAEQRGTALRGGRDNRHIRILAARQTCFRDVAPGKAVRFLHPPVQVVERNRYF